MKNKKKKILKLAAITLAAALAAITFAGCSGTQNGSADDEKTQIGRASCRERV